MKVKYWRMRFAALFHFGSIDNFERTVLHKFPENKEDTLQKHDDIFALKTNEKIMKIYFLEKIYYY